MSITALILRTAITLFASVALAQTTAAIHIVSPQEGDKIEASVVIVHYELAAGVSAAGSATFRLQLDGDEPVKTTAGEYTFTGLASGAHVVTVAVVDANGTPIYSAQDQVRFSLSPPE